MKQQRMWPSMFLPNSEVGTSLHRLECRAVAAGCTTLAQFQAFRRTNA